MPSRRHFVLWAGLVWLIAPAASAQLQRSLAGAILVTSGLPGASLPMWSDSMPDMGSKLQMPDRFCSELTLLQHLPT